jgi:membrane fusion protein, multidrug efflux system
MKRFPPWLLFVLVLVVLIAVKLLFFPKKEEPKAAQARPGAAALSVSYFVVRPDTFTTEASATGRVGAFNAVDVYPEVSARVTEIRFREGEAVKKGELLVKLNDADLQAQLLKLRNQLKLAEQKHTRVKRLYEMKGVSEEELQTQENEIASLKADEAFVIAQLAKTTIVAPFDGVAGLKSISEGAYVTPAKSIVSIVQMQPLFVEFSLPEKYFSQLRKGARITFSLGQLQQGAAVHTATVFAIEPRVDEMTRSIRARARFDHAEGIFPGAFVNVHVDMGRMNNALLVPTQAVVPTMKGQKVYVSRKDTAEETMVQTGVRTAERIQVLSGLRPGDTVIVTGLLGLKKDSKVRLSSEVR